MDYSDIINLPHPDPKNHPRMPLEQRAQQLMPFASLPKYFDELEEAINTTTDEIDTKERSLP